MLVRSLCRENLDAFDAEFWEQLEDLKYEHAQYKEMLQSHGLLDE